MNNQIIDNIKNEIKTTQTNQLIQCVCCGEGTFNTAVERANIHSNVRAFKTETFPVWRCNQCNSIHSSSRVDLSRYYSRYSFGKRKLDGWTRKVFGVLYNRLTHFGFHKDSTLLDFGCSEGLFLKYLQEKAHSKCNGFDPYSTKFKTREVLLKKYDYVFTQDVLEHVENPKAVLKKWHGLLKPNGVLFVGTPNADHLNINNPEDDIHSLHQPYHRHIYSSSALRKMIKDLGFEILKIYRNHYCQTLFPTVNWNFIKQYTKAIDNTLDAGFDPPQPLKVLRSPKLMFYALFGGLLPAKSEMMFVLRKMPNT